VLEKDCSAQTLMQNIQELLKDRQKYSQMQKSLLSMAVPDCAERLCAIMETLAGK